MSVKLEIRDEVNIKLHNLPLDVRKKLVATFKYEIPHAKYQPAYKLGRWDGTVSLFGLGGNGYLSQLEKILEVLGKMGIQIEEIDDQRKPINLTFNKVSEDYWAERGVVWPEGHVMAGQPIMLRDYQVDTINAFLENPQGIQSICTGAGKCVSYDTELEIIIDEKSAFGKYLLEEHEIFHVILIGEFVELVSKFYKTALTNNQEIALDGISIDTPSGEFPITHVIKKYELPMLKLTFDNGYELECAERHIVRKDGNDIFAIDLVIGDLVVHRNGTTKLISVESNGIADCYDISVPSPHLYYDANGLVHHNTITTATLSHLCEPYGKTIVIVPSKSLVEQTEEDYLNCGLDVGVYYGNRKDLYKTHTICTWQSLNVLDKKSKNDEQEVITLTEFLEGVSAVIADEVHTVTGAILTKLLTQNLGNAPIRWGLTGTIPKDAYAFESIFTSIGPVIGTGVRAKELQERGVLSKCHVKVVQMLDIMAFKNYSDELRYLVTNVERVQYIGNMIKTIAESGNTLVLVDRIQTGKMLVDMLDGAVFISGAVKVKDRKTELDEVKTVDNKIIVASFGTMSTGVSVNRIFNLVLLEAGKSFTRVIQSIGRGVRTAPDKDFVQIWDITSTCKYAKRHMTERKRFYKEAEYPFTIEKVDWNK